MSYADAARAVSFVTVDAEGHDRVGLALAFTELRGTLSWSDAGKARLHLEAALPAGDHRLVLRPEKGVGGALDALGEIELDDPLVDDAWVVRGDDAGLVLAMLPELRALAALGDVPSILVEATTIDVTFAKLEAEKAQRAVEGALALWHRVAFFRLA